MARYAAGSIPETTCDDRDQALTQRLAPAFEGWPRLSGPGFRRGRVGGTSPGHPLSKTGVTPAETTAVNST
jgi:hypothetical protein